jgi:hypothetical protein
VSNERKAVENDDPGWVIDPERDRRYLLHTPLQTTLLPERLLPRNYAPPASLSSTSLPVPRHGRVTPHSKGAVHRVLFLCCGVSLLDHNLFSEGSTRPHEGAHNNIMETLSTAEVISKGRGSETNQIPNGQQYVSLGNRRDGRPCLTEYNWPGQSDQSLVRGHEESDFMTSQLG